LEGEERKAHKRLTVSPLWLVAHNQKELNEIVPTSLQKTAW